MNKIIAAKPLDGFRILATFLNGEKRIGDISGLLEKPVFAFLKDRAAFERVYIAYGALTWKNADGEEVDICPDKFYLDSTPVS